MNLLQISALLGKNLESPGVRQLLQRCPSIERFSSNFALHENVPVQHYLSDKSKGLQIRLSQDNDIEVIFLMSEGKDGYRQCDFTLSKSLMFSSNASDVIEQLGRPDFYRPESIDLLLGSVGEIVRYDYPDKSLHFQLKTSGQGIELITLSIPSCTPGRK